MPQPSPRVLARILEVAHQALPPRGRLWLYGSRARGDAQPDSDWDLLILLDKPRIEQRDYDEVLYPFTYLGWDIDENISPVLYTNEEWTRCAFLPFHKNVEHDKIELV